MKSNALDFQAYWAQVEQIMVRVFEDDTFLEELTRALVNLDRAGFQLLVENALRNLRKQVTDMEIRWKNMQFEIGGAYLAGSFQFESAVFGQWFRFRLAETNTEHYQPTPDPLRLETSNSVFSALDEEYFEQVLTEAPREDTLLLNQHLRRPFCVQFGGERPPASQFVLWVNQDAWKTLRGVVYSTHDILLNRSHGLVLASPSSTIVDLLAEMDRVLRTQYLDKSGREWLGPELRRNIGSGTKPAERHQYELARRLRIFLLTYFYTIMQKGPILPHEAIYHLILPIFLGDKWIGSFCGAYGIPPHRRIPGLSRAYNGLCRRLYAIECLALKQLPSARVSVAESMVRLCTVVPPPGEPLPVEMNRWQTAIVQTLGTHHRRRNGHFVDAELEKIASGMVSASDAMFRLIDQVRSRVEEAQQELRPQSIFLYSSPGLGKESIARLCHYLSRRSYDSAVVSNRIKTAWREAGRLGVRWTDSLLSDERKQCLTKTLKLTPGWHKNRSFNYTAKNAGTLEPGDYVGELFGTQDLPGVLTGASLLAGTVFLDEVNTARKEVINGLLRALESPYSVEPKGVARTIRLNLLVVFASNVPLERLLNDPYDFNPAFIDRMNADFEIPPLSTRKEDIPLLVNRFLQKYVSNTGQRIRFIELSGLRLLMEIPWKRNVRTIRTFLDDLMKARGNRTLSDEAFRTVSFEEIIQCLARGHYL